MGHDTIDAELAACDVLSLQATQAGAHAFARLLKLAETRDSGQIPRIARFLAATYNGHAFQLNLFEMRAVDIAGDVPQPVGTGGGLIHLTRRAGVRSAPAGQEQQPAPRGP
jgi:hypothetical protein